MMKELKLIHRLQFLKDTVTSRKSLVLAQPYYRNHRNHQKFS